MYCSASVDNNLAQKSRETCLGMRRIERFLGAWAAMCKAPYVVGMHCVGMCFPWKGTGGYGKVQRKEEGHALSVWSSLFLLVFLLLSHPSSCRKWITSRKMFTQRTFTTTFPNANLKPCYKWYWNEKPLQLRCDRICSHKMFIIFQKLAIGRICN